MNMVNTSKHHGAEKAIINALLKISEIVKKSAAGRLSEKSRPFVPQSSSTLGSGDVKHQVSAARQIWEERRYEPAQPVCGKRKSCVHRRTCESSRKRRRYDTSSTSSNERDSHQIHSCRQRRYTKHRVGCQCQVSKHDQHSASNC